MESFFENYFLDEPIVEKYGFKEKVLYLQVKLRKIAPISEKIRMLK